MPTDSVSIDVSSQNTANWRQISTQNAGLLSLPPEWDVISKDDPEERELDADRMLHVQQVLYARSGKTLNARGAALQIFSIWNADLEGKILPLPSNILEKTGRDLIADLIDARYGNVKMLTQEIVGTDLEDLFVTTYGVEFLPAENNSEDRPSEQEVRGKDFRYRCASLFYGEKLVLVLVKYFPDYEKYWSGEFEALLNAWVVSLALTPRPFAEMAETVPLPALPVLAAQETNPPVPVSQPISSPSADVAVVSHDFLSPDNVVPLPAELSEALIVSTLEVDPEPQENLISSFVLYGGLSLVVFVIFFACAGSVFNSRRKKQEETALTEETEIEATEEESDPTEEYLDPEIFDEQNSPEEDHGEAAPVSGEERDEGTEELHLEENSDEDSDSTWSPMEDEFLSFIGDTYAFETKRDTFPEKLGFDQVYSLLNQALVSMDATQVATAPVVSDEPILQPALPNLANAVEVLDNLKAVFGESFLLEALKEEILKTLELKEGTPILQTKDITPECFVLKLCCSTLLNMLQTGRYHIGKGILSNEGQELVNLFGCINGLRTKKAYSSPEEAEKDAAFMQFCVRELG